MTSRNPHSTNYPHDCEHPREQHLGPEGVCQTPGCLCIAADYYLHHDRPVATVTRLRSQEETDA